MNTFADTFYFMALLNRKDSAHAAARAHSSGPGRILTTQWVLTELADAMCSRRKRKRYVDLYQVLRSDTDVEIVPASAELFDRGTELFSERPIRTGRSRTAFRLS
jgi:predicted nucleic acid-binding protein